MTAERSDPNIFATARGLAKTTAGAIAARIVTAILGLMSVPLLIDALGKDGYGLYATILASSIFLVFVDQGVAVATRTSTARYLARGDLGLARYAYEYSRLAVAVIAASMAIIAIGLLSILFAAGSGSPDAPRAMLVLLYLGLYSACLVFAVPLRTLEGAGRSAIVALLPMAGSLWILLCAAAGAYWSLGIVFQVAAAALGLVPAGIIGAILARRSLPRAAVPTLDARIGVRRELRKSAWPMAIISTMAAVIAGSGPIVVSTTLGVSAAAEYAAVAKIAAVGMILVSAGSPVLWTHFVSMRERGTNHSLRRRIELAGVVTALSAIVGITFALIAPWFTSMWVGFETTDIVPIAWGFAAYIIVTGGQLVVGNALNDAASLRFQCVTITIAATAAVIAGVLLTRFIGPAGAPVGAALGLLLFHAVPLWVRWLRRAIADKVV